MSESEPVNTKNNLAQQQLATLQKYESAVVKSQSALESPQFSESLDGQQTETVFGDGSKVLEAESKIAEFGDIDIESALLLNPSAAANISFRLQACEINQWIVLVNEDDLQNPTMQTLWHNILKAFNQPTIVNFSWPLSEGQRWQRTIGAKSALNGFLFRMGLDKRVGLMSELSDDICPDRLERLPHLAELLAEPLKKRTLWHLLKAQ